MHKLNFYIASHVNANGVLFMRSRAVINRIITPVKKEKNADTVLADELTGCIKLHDTRSHECHELYITNLPSQFFHHIQSHVTSATKWVD